MNESLQAQPPRRGPRRPSLHHRPFLLRRMVALVVFAAIVAAAIAIPLACAGGDEGAGGTLSAPRSTTTLSASPSTTTLSSTAASTATSGATTITGSSSTTIPGSSATTLPSGSATTLPAGSATTSVPPGAVTAARAKEIGANELGRIPVLMYHLVGIGKSHLAPDQLRFHIALLRSHGFYPTTIREMVEGTMEIPAGKTPVILTFDDSSPGQYRVLDDGTLDPDCAVGILQAEVARGSWAPKATFFPLLDVNQGNILFGQPESARLKLQNLVEWGYEVGSHGLSHMDFSRATAAQVRKELARSQAQLESLIGNGYEVFTVSPPYGEYPSDVSLLLSGEYDGVAYSYRAVVMAWGESAPSPFSSKFDPTHIPRITSAAPESVKKLLKYWNDHRPLLYISDGDPTTISFPKGAPAELGTLRPGLHQRVVEY